MFAARNGHALAVEALLAGGADTRPVDKVRQRGSGGQNNKWMVGWCGRGWFDPLGVVSFVVLLSSEWGAWPPADGTLHCPPRHFPAPH
jgi:hypothetical protein